MTFLSMIVTGKLFTAIRATELGSTRVFYPDEDLLRLHIELHL
jgi:hypothetical protein